jgi:hypothetical protein
MMTWVDKSVDDGDNWAPVPSGHFTLVLNGAAVLAITEGPGTLTQKRATLLALLKAEVASRGIDSADDADNQLRDLLPGSDWPVTVAL